MPRGPGLQSAFGCTQVLCTVSITPGVPPFLRGKGQGWLTRNTACCQPAAHAQRSGGCAESSGRTQEIQRLIAPSHGCGSLSPWGDHPQGGLRCAPGGRRYANCSDFRARSGVGFELAPLASLEAAGRLRSKLALTQRIAAQPRALQCEGRPGARFGLRRRLYGGNGQRNGVAAEDLLVSLRYRARRRARPSRRRSSRRW